MASPRDAFRRRVADGPGKPELGDSGAHRHRTYLRGEPEVDKLQLAGTGDHQVIRLQIAMHETGSVDGGQGGDKLIDEALCRRGFRREAGENIAKGSSFDILHHKISEPAVRPKVQQTHNSGMLEFFESFPLAIKLLISLRIAAASGGRTFSATG